MNAEEWRLLLEQHRVKDVQQRNATNDNSVTHVTNRILVRFFQHDRSANVLWGNRAYSEELATCNRIPLGALHPQVVQFWEKIAPALVNVYFDHAIGELIGDCRRMKTRQQISEFLEEQEVDPQDAAQVTIKKTIARVVVGVILEQIQFNPESSSTATSSQLWTQFGMQQPLKDETGLVVKKNAPEVTGTVNFLWYSSGHCRIIELKTTKLAHLYGSDVVQSLLHRMMLQQLLEHVQKVKQLMTNTTTIRIPSFQDSVIGVIHADLRSKHCTLYWYSLRLSNHLEKVLLQRDIRRFFSILWPQPDALNLNTTTLTSVGHSLQVVHVLFPAGLYMTSELSKKVYWILIERGKRCVRATLTSTNVGLIRPEDVAFCFNWNSPEYLKQIDRIPEATKTMWKSKEELLNGIDQIQVDSNTVVEIRIMILFEHVNGYGVFNMVGRDGKSKLK